MRANRHRKTTLLANMALHDIEAGQGAVVVDAGGAFVARILERIPEHRRDDVIGWTPPPLTTVVGLNPSRRENRNRPRTSSTTSCIRFTPSRGGRERRTLCVRPAHAHSYKGSERGAVHAVQCPSYLPTARSPLRDSATALASVGVVLAVVRI